MMPVIAQVVATWMRSVTSGPYHPQELANGMPSFDRVAQGLALVYFVVGSAPLAGAHNHTRRLQFAQDSLDSTFGDADSLGDFAHPNVRVPNDADQYMPVITKESPCGGGFWGPVGIHLTSIT